MQATAWGIDLDSLLFALPSVSLLLVVGLLVEPWVARAVPSYRCHSYAERGALLDGLLYGGISLPYLLLFFRVAVRLQAMRFIYGLGIVCLCLAATIPYAVLKAHQARQQEAR